MDGNIDPFINAYLSANTGQHPSSDRKPVLANSGFVKCYEQKKG